MRVLLNIRLSDRDVTVLMTRFDRSENGMVDLVDILGNAKLYYERSVQEQKTDADLMQLRAKNDIFMRQQRQNRMEEKSVIKKMLAEKIFEIEKEMNVESGSTLDDYSFIQHEQSLVEDDVISTEYVPGVDSLLDSLREVAFSAYRDKKLRYLDAAPSKISPGQFKELLYVFGMYSKELYRTLLQRYEVGTDGALVDAGKFKKDFKGIAMNEVQQKKQTNVVSSFYRALSGTDKKSPSNATFTNDSPKDKDMKLSVAGMTSMKHKNPIGATHELAVYNTFVKDLDARQIALQKRMEPMEEVGRRQIELNADYANQSTQSKVQDEGCDEPTNETVGETQDVDREYDKGEDIYADEYFVDDHLHVNKNFSELVLLAEKDHSESGDYEDSFDSMSSEERHEKHFNEASSEES